MRYCFIQNKQAPYFRHALGSHPGITKPLVFFSIFFKVL